MSSGDLIFRDSLPPELIRECIGRIPISEHPIASQVSKDLHDYIKTRKLYEKRQEYSLRENVIFVALLRSSPSFLIPEWYTICKKAYLNEYVLRPIPNFPSIRGNHSLVTAGSKIYAIGGASPDKKTTPEVLCIDCATFKDVSVPKMNFIHSCPETAIIKDKLFVIGGCKPQDSQAFMESLDLASPKEWQVVKLASAPNPTNLPSMCEKVILGSNIYFINNRGLGCTVFDTTKLTMERNDEAAMGNYDYSTSCVINKRLYAFNQKRNHIKVYMHARVWARVKGLQNLPEFGNRSRLLNCNGKLLVTENSDPTKIFITSISLKAIGGEIWGEIESTKLALELPYPTTILHTLEVQL